jgi:N-acetylglucosamine kinase-like BadF-type ATPase
LPLDLLLGLDGGGTKTAAWLAPLQDDGTDRVLGRGQSGPGNPRAAGFETALNNIDAAIAAAFADAKLPRQAAAAACFALAGAGRPSEQQQITAWAQNRGIAQKIQVCGDAEAVLAAASPDNVGIALICGTGSLAWGRNQSGQTARCGGWGYLLGDEGSAYAIALAGLRAAVRAADSRGPLTALLARFQNELHATSPQDLIDRIYSPDMTRERLAGLAHIVFDCAQRDDTAREIVTSGAAQLAEMVAVLCRQLQLPAKSYPLALAGGVMISESHLSGLVLGFLNEQQAAPANVAAVSDPVRGAVALARALSFRTTGN